MRNKKSFLLAISLACCLSSCSLDEKVWEPQSEGGEITGSVEQNDTINKRAFEILNLDYPGLENVKAYYEKNEYYLEIIDYALRSVLFKIFRDHSKQNTKRQLSFANVATLEEAIEYIHTHYNEQITLAAFASRYNFSPNYFNFIFKQHTSQTLKKYIQKLRCEKACKLLEQDDMSIDALAEQVGYSDTKQFFYLFKRNVGTTPGKYRSKIKNTNK